MRISHPGQSVRFVAEHVPRLTKRQELVLHTVRAFNGSRSQAARHLNVTVAAVQKSLRYAEQAGAVVPRARSRAGIPNSTRRTLSPRCGRIMRSGACGRATEHPGFCVNEQAWQRKRTPEPVLFPRP